MPTTRLRPRGHSGGKADHYTERSLYQVMSDSPPPMGEGTKARRRLDLRKYENEYVKVTKSLSRLQRERRRYGVTSAVDID
jgi:hypothetical protein